MFVVDVAVNDEEIFIRPRPGEEDRISAVVSTRRPRKKTKQSETESDENRRVKS